MIARIVVALLLCFACKSSAPAPTAAPPTAPSQPAEDTKPSAKPAELASVFLYRVTKAGVTNYLFGTMHMGVAPERLPKRVWDALATAKVFAMETNVNDPAAIMAVMRNDDSSLADELGPAYWAKFEKAAGGMASGMKKMKAWAALAVLQMKELPQTASMDAELAVRADKAGAKSLYLEPVQYQMSVVEKWLTTDMLKKMLDLPAGFTKAETAKLLTAYEGGDEKAVLELFADVKTYEAMGMTSAQMEAFKQDLLYTRNANWVDKLDGGLLQAGGVFAAVGAGHLLGTKSVVELLQARGYSIERL